MGRARAAVLLLAIAAAGCSTRAPAPPVTARETDHEPALQSWLCSENPNAFSLESVGVPAGSRGRDIALGTDQVVVLLEPARILTFSRLGKPRVLEMFVGAPEDQWSGLASDPQDGSLWVVSTNSLELVRFSGDGSRSRIRIPGVEGSGGFRDVVAVADSLYLLPTDGTSGIVWRIDRSGKILGRDFQPPAADPDRVEVAGFGWGLLAVNEAREAHFLSTATGELSKAQADGVWSPTGLRFRPADAGARRRALRGEAIGTGREVWYFADEAKQLFFLRNEPSVLGGSVRGGDHHGSLIRQVRGGREDYGIEVCAGASFASVAADPLGFAAVTDGGNIVRTDGSVAEIVSPVLLMGAWRN